MEIHSPNNYYGHGYIIKEYAKFPLYIPLPVVIHHGWYSPAPKHNLYSSSNPQEVWVWSKRIADEYKARGRKNIRIIGAPIIYVSKKLRKRKRRKGTIAFPAHSAGTVDVVGNFEEYALQLKSLPKEFHPITVCLSYFDFKKGYDEVYKRLGFNVISNGKVSSHKFLFNFIENVSKYKYATSNKIGTSDMYSIYFGLKYFYYGSPFDGYNHSNPHLPRGMLKWKPSSYRKELMKEWSINNIDKSQNQINIVKSALGERYKKTPFEMQRLINSLFLKHLRRLNKRKTIWLIDKIYNDQSYRKKNGGLFEALEGFDFIWRMEKFLNKKMKEKYISGAYFHMAEIYKKIRKKRLAALYYKKCLQNNASHSKAYKRLIVLNKG